MSIHPTAIIEEGAQLADDVEVGAYAYIGADVTLDAGCVVQHHGTVDGFTHLGLNNTVFPFACVGTKTQDLKFSGGKPGLKAGENNTFREYVTIHGGTKDGTYTTIGSHNHFLAYSHVAHDCILGDHIIMSGQNALAGHCQVGNHVIISWGTGAHQFCRFGDYAFVGGMTRVVKDVPPYMLVEGHDAGVKLYNKVGLQRNGFDDADMAVVRFIFKTVYKSGLNRSQALKAIEESEFAAHPRVSAWVDFVKASERGCY